jgi:hypothetical protein
MSTFLPKDTDRKRIWGVAATSKRSVLRIRQVNPVPDHDGAVRFGAGAC